MIKDEHPPSSLAQSVSWMTSYPHDNFHVKGNQYLIFYGQQPWLGFCKVLNDIFKMERYTCRCTYTSCIPCLHAYIHLLYTHTWTITMHNLYRVHVSCSPYFSNRVSFWTCLCLFCLRMESETSIETGKFKLEYSHCSIDSGALLPPSAI